MKRCVCLWLLAQLLCGCVSGSRASPVHPGSCEDPHALAAADLALGKINTDRSEGFVFSLNRLNNVNHQQHGTTGMVFYLTMDVLETSCHILSKRDWKSCAIRQTHDTPVYGQCKATIYINKVQRIVQLYNYDCVLRPAPKSRIQKICPDCPSQVSTEDDNILRTANMALEKYNRESGNSNYFALLNITRASSQWDFGEFYFVEFIIQETVCSNGTDIIHVAECELMSCEFAHKGHCKGSQARSQGKEYVTVSCDIFETKSSEKQKKQHLLETGHSHGGRLGHRHRHTHLHPHEHHHDHTPAAPTSPTPERPLGTVQYLPALKQLFTLPSFHDEYPTSFPAQPVPLPIFPDQPEREQPANPTGILVVPETVPETGEEDPVFLPFPSTLSMRCPGKPKNVHPLLQELFGEDPLFHHPIDIVG
ncbi:FETUB protein, partial [Amia calva]|nr:FETUB protein [Amia calva]